MAKHFQLSIKDDAVTFEVNQPSVAAAAAMDGVYVIRASQPEEKLSAADVVPPTRTSVRSSARSAPTKASTCRPGPSTII